MSADTMMGMMNRGMAGRDLMPAGTDPVVAMAGYDLGPAPVKGITFDSVSSWGRCGRMHGGSMPQQVVCGVQL